MRQLILSFSVSLLVGFAADGSAWAKSSEPAQAKPTLTPTTNMAAPTPKTVATTNKSVAIPNKTAAKINRSAAANATKPVAALTGIKLDQVSTRTGAQQIVVSPSGIRIDQQNFTTVSAAPNWSIYILNNKTHCFYRASAAQLTDRLAWIAKMTKRQWFDKLPMKESGNTKGKGEFRLSELLFKPSETDNSLIKQGMQLRGAQMWTLFDSSLPQQAIRLAQQFDNLPQVGGVPVQFDWTDPEGSPFNYLETGAIKRCKVTADDFRPPKTYKEVETLAAVRSDASTREAEKYLLQLIDQDGERAIPSGSYRESDLKRRNAQQQAAKDKNR